MADLIDVWLAEERATNPAVEAVEVDRSEGLRWFLRVRGEAKDVFSIWFTLRQRTLHAETYLMPAPEENHAAFYEHLLRRNRSLHGLAFAIGEEDAIFLQAEVPLATLDRARLDEILGSIFEAVERVFRPALRIGFASRLGR